MPDATTPEPTGAPGAFELVQRAAGPRLGGIVTRMIGYRELANGHFRQVEAASLTVPLIINFGGSFAIGLGRAPGTDDRVGSFAAGLFAGPVIIDSFGNANCLQIDFTPLGAARFFRMPMTELTDRMVALDDVLGADGRSFREQLANTPSWNDRFVQAVCFVERRLADAPETSPALAWVFERISATGGRVPVRALAENIGWSRKHLAGRFNADIGLGPKAVARIVRFNRVLALSRGDETSGWADIAAVCGYADQAHLAREFRDLAGSTPAAWLARPA